MPAPHAGAVWHLIDFQLGSHNTSHGGVTERVVGCTGGVGSRVTGSYDVQGDVRDDDAVHK